MSNQNKPPVYSDKVILKGVRMVYPALDKPTSEGPSGMTVDARYTVNIVIKTDDPQYASVRDAILKCMNGYFGNGKQLGKDAILSLRNPLKDPSDVQIQKFPDTYEGAKRFEAKKKASVGKPSVQNAQGEVASESDFARFCYNGALCDVSVTFGSYRMSDTNQGVTCYLNAVRLGSIERPPSDDFGPPMEAPEQAQQAPEAVPASDEDIPF